jgi:MFS family permease
MADAAVAGVAAAATAVVAQGAASAVAPATNAPQKVDVGTVAALGVAFGAIGGFFAAVATLGKDLWAQGVFAMVGAILGIMLLISGPSLVMTYIKLRKRNLGPILDANGWAVNAKARINVPFGTRLTAIAELPPGSTRDLVDPFEETRRPWRLYLVLALTAYMGWQWSAGRLDSNLPKRMRYSHVFPSESEKAGKDAVSTQTNSVAKPAQAP